jgi:hypothetical protein
MNRFTIVSSGLFLGALALGALSAGACGGLPDTDALFGNGTTGVGASSVGPTSGVTTTGAVTSASTTGAGTGGLGTTGSTSSTFASTSASSSTAAASSTSGGPTTTTTTTTTTASSSSGTTAPPLACAGGSCGAGQVCCFNPSGPGDHCGTKGNCPQGYSELSCSDPADCPGGVCCAQFQLFNMQVYYTGISCQPSCNNQGSEFVICGPTETSVCPPGTQCIQSQLLGSGYMICAN